MAINLLSRKSKEPGERSTVSKSREKAQMPYKAADPIQLDSDDLVQHMQLGRYGIIAAHPDRWQNHPHIHEYLQKAHDAIDEEFSLVPGGCAAMPNTVNDSPGCPETDVDTRPFVLARHTVTNRQFQNFVDGGGYDELDLWPQEIWPHIIDFKDQTEHPGPRFWRNGRHNKNLSNHPVVGICFHEAVAYTRWAGYRLPGEAEWQVAASWRIKSSSYVLRRYPWGDALDKNRCNIWASGVGNTAEVSAYESGAAPNGILQLVGNVWEWTNSDFSVTDEDGNQIVGDMLLKSVRGGAFDTYFPIQATSCFRTGLASLVRVHNTGFRCALDICNSGKVVDSA